MCVKLNNASDIAPTSTEKRSERVLFFHVASPVSEVTY
jgi:hypothetical protein